MKKLRLLATVVTTALLVSTVGEVPVYAVDYPQEIRKTVTGNQNIILTETAAFEGYIHDPMKNPKAAKDIIVDSNAVYGYSPNPESTRLGGYAQYDWSDREFVAEMKQVREEYHESMQELYVMISDMRAAGKETEEIARAVSTRRNELRLESYKDDPEGLEIVKASNLATYGNENGPTPEYLYEKYGSWETVIEKALSSNPGADACLGLYDKYYDTYMLEDETETGDSTKDETKTKDETLPEDIATAKYSIKDAKVVLLKKNFTYNGKINKPAIKTIGGKTLTAGTDYTVKWSNASSRNVGVYTVTITGKDNYTGTTMATYKINPKGTSIKRLKASEKAVTVMWNKQTAKMSKAHITGYQVQFANSKSFTKNKMVSVNGFKKTSKKVTRLKSRKKYFVRIRTYKTIKGEKFYSSWSKIKTIKVS